MFGRAGGVAEGRFCPRFLVSGEGSYPYCCHLRATSYLLVTVDYRHDTERVPKQRFACSARL